MNMSNLKVHRVKGKSVIKRYRMIPYADLVEVLRDDGEAFLEDGEGEYRLKRSTVWKAARRLSELVGKPVQVCRALLKVGEETIEGYSFWVEESKG
ncbi:MAG: hypothetical protein QXK90_01170 [Candidatus Parvarchaeota archaeon]